MSFCVTPLEFAKNFVFVTPLEFAKNFVFVTPLEFAKNFVFTASLPLRGASCYKSKNKDPADAGSIFVSVTPFVIIPSVLSQRSHGDENAPDFIRGIFGFVTPLGFEPKTHSLEGCCSIQLSYGAPLVCGCKISVLIQHFKPLYRFFDTTPV